MTDFDPVELLKALEAGKVDFIVVGGFAVIAHGVVRATKDLDIVPSTDPANLDRLATALRSINAEQIGVESDTIPPYDTLAAQAVEVTFEGMKLKVCSLDHLRFMKRASGRPQDLRDLEDLDIANEE